MRREDFSHSLLGLIYRGIQTKKGVKASDALKSLFDPRTKEKLSIDCATAQALIYLLGYMRTIGEEAFDKLFPNGFNLRLAGFNSSKRNQIFPLFGVPGVTIQQLAKTDLIPGDLRAFDNPGRLPMNLAYETENVVYLGGDLYFAQPFGIVSRDQLTALLLAKAKPGAVITEYGLGSPGRR